MGRPHWRSCLVHRETQHLTRVQLLYGLFAMRAAFMGPSRWPVQSWGWRTLHCHATQLAFFPPAVVSWHCAMSCGFLWPRGMQHRQQQQLVVVVVAEVAAATAQLQGWPAGHLQPAQHSSVGSGATSCVVCQGLHAAVKASLPPTYRYMTQYMT